LSGIAFPGSAPSRTLSAKPAMTTPAKRVSLYGSSAAQTAQAKQVNAASNSGTLVRNQFLDGGTGDIGLQWRDVVVKGSVRVEHNTCSINVVGDASDTGPISISNIRFDSGWGLSGAHSDCLYLTPPVTSAPSLRDISATAAAFGSSVNAASNSATLTGGQFLDGGMGQIGLQWQGVTINSPVRIVNNVIAVTVSGTNTYGVSLQNVSFA
jgi:hypothetical protein